ncbi:hypothetical protein J5N58_12235 [Rhizobium cremeum]|uniref:hypothetical protein n=1 Tax=Rhizobium cremeum TaxID=2813827 RepID=UPI000DDF27AC|nr:hypothetical protein [Rhizobium cremeum]MCJ7995244.1 hypothetical protein [Rhizobium cremeum]MCJ8000444.1 hypothetical protein [Rhizobium cremeum]
MSKTLTIEQIDQSTNRLPFSEKEIFTLIEFVKLSRKKGRDLQTGARNLAATAEHVLQLAQEEGIIAINSAILGMEVLFAKVDAGRSFFGGQKAAYISYVNTGDDEWAVGTTFNSWPIAVTSIGNIYRGMGYR